MLQRKFFHSTKLAELSLSEERVKPRAQPSNINLRQQTNKGG